MAQDSVLIIGAGLAGLSTGVFAQLNGYRSRIFEHHAVPGGVAATWKRGEYTIDGGIHFLMGYRPGTATYELYRQVGATEGGRFLDLVTYAAASDEATGRQVALSADVGRFAAELKAVSPTDAAAIDELVAATRALQGSGGLALSMDKPLEMVGPLDRVRQMWALRRVVRYFRGKWAKSVAEYTQGFRDPWVQWVLQYLFLPDVPVWFLLMILALVADGQLALLEAGALDFAQAIERRYRELGGEVTYRATVEQILVEDDRAVGVRLADGSEHRADTVVSAADGYSTIFTMLGGRYADDQTRERYRSWKLIRPTLVVSFGVAREFPGEPWLHMVKLERPLAIGNESSDLLPVRLLNYSRCFAPPGKTVVQVMLEADWDYWSDLRQDRPRYEAEKQRVAGDVLERLERRYPGLASQVEVTDVATPVTTWRYTRNHRGACMGWLPTAKALMTEIPRTLPGLQNLYLAGQWVMPGGGVPPCLYSGRHVVQLICRRDGKPFVTGSAS